MNVLLRKEIAVLKTILESEGEGHISYFKRPNKLPLTPAQEKAIKLEPEAARWDPRSKTGGQFWSDLGDHHEARLYYGHEALQAARDAAHAHLDAVDPTNPAHTPTAAHRQAHLAAAHQLIGLARHHENTMKTAGKALTGKDLDPDNRTPESKRAFKNLPPFAPASLGAANELTKRHAKLNLAFMKSGGPAQAKQPLPTKDQISQMVSGFGGG